MNMNLLAKMNVVTLRASKSSFARPSASSERARAPSQRSRNVVTTQALFGLGKKARDGPMICLDCGYVVQSGFNDLPRNYKCPVCNVGKARFKPAPKSQGMHINSLIKLRNIWIVQHIL
jgi:rubrerythrin